MFFRVGQYGKIYLYLAPSEEPPAISSQIAFYKYIRHTHMDLFLILSLSSDTETCVCVYTS